MTGNRNRGRPAHPDILTPGEWRVAKAARFGMTNRQIAERYEIGVEAAMACGLAAGGTEVSPVGFRPYGEYQGGLGDPAGNIWWLSQRLAPGAY